MKCDEIKLGFIMYIIREHMVAVRTVKNAFKLVTQLVTQITDLVGLIWQVIPHRERNIKCWHTIGAR